MSREEKSLFRHYAFWFATEPDKEEPILTKMSRKGWHLERAAYCRFLFRRGEPIGHQYRMDLMDREHRGEEYEQMYQDAGWEKVCESRDEYGRWSYFRRPEVEGEIQELYTDTESKLDLLYRIRRNFKRRTLIILLLLPLFAFLLAVANNAIGSIWRHGGFTVDLDMGFVWSLTLGGIIGGTIGGGIVFLLFWQQLNKKIEQLKESKL